MSAAKPTVLKRLAGFPGHASRKECLELPAGKVSCPKKLKGHARREWQRLMPVLAAAGLIGPGNREAFTGYCLAVQRQWELQAELETSSTMVLTKAGDIKVNPCFAAADRAALVCLRFLQEFGLTPSAASRIQFSAPAGKKSKADREDEKFFGDGEIGVPIRVS